MWKAIPGYEGLYEASDDGEIRRIGIGRGVSSGRILKQAYHKQGYRSVSVYKDNRGKTFLTHRLIAITFIGPINKGYEINHLDGNKHNNNVSNLEIVTRSHNIRHAMKYGLMNLQGHDNPMSKLTADQVSEIRYKHAAGLAGYKKLGSEYNVSWECIRNIIKGRVWNYDNAY